MKVQKVRTSRLWLLCAQAFWHDVFLLGWWICVQSIILQVSRCGHCKYLFVSEQNDVNVIGWMFLSNCFEWPSFPWEFASLRSGSLRFLTTNVLQGSVATRLMCDRTFYYYFVRNKFTANSVAERILKIGIVFDEVRGKKKQSGTFFPDVCGSSNDTNTNDLRWPWRSLQPFETFLNPAY